MPEAHWALAFSTSELQGPVGPLVLRRAQPEGQQARELPGEHMRECASGLEPNCPL